MSDLQHQFEFDMVSQGRCTQKDLQRTDTGQYFYGWMNIAFAFYQIGYKAGQNDRNRD